MSAGCDHQLRRPPDVLPAGLRPRRPPVWPLWEAGLISARLHWLIGIGIVIVAAVLPFVFSNFTTSQILTRALILGLAAASLIFLASLGGWVSLAQLGLYGVAGFTVGNLVQADGGAKVFAMDIWLASLLALVVTVLVGLLIGVIASRSEGIYFLMITLAFGVIIKLLFEKATDLSGFGGINQIIQPAVLGSAQLDPERIYWVCLAICVLVYLGIRYFAHTPFGLAFQGIRDNTPRMRALGYNVTLIRTVAFGIAAFIAGLAGVLNVWWNTQISPGTIDIGPVIFLLMIAIIGGLYRIEGAWVGALIYVILDNRLRSVDLVGERVATALGIVFLLIVLLSPGGVMGIYKSLASRWRRSRSESGAARDGDGTAAPTVAGD
ncbi:MAG: branched-chain amino acid ABC transporter permease [Thermoleophilia bacterium]|nr:branched-chain amino acid ABC transporter permease [Thermoleophilia bacterium]